MAATLKEACETKRYITGKAKQFFVEKGFGFVTTGENKDVFVHAVVVRAGRTVSRDRVVVMRVVVDSSEGEGKYKAVECWLKADWEAEQAA